MESGELRPYVQAFLAVVSMLTVVYMSIQGQLPPEVITGLAGMAVGFFVAERKNGAERAHEQRVAELEQRLVERLHMIEHGAVLD